VTSFGGSKVFGRCDRIAFYRHWGRSSVSKDCWNGVDRSADSGGLAVVSTGDLNLPN
jgi:hypothetical protein